MKKPLKAVDRRRGARKQHGVGGAQSTGAAEPLADLFNDRRNGGNGSGARHRGHSNGTGKRTT